MDIKLKHTAISLWPKSQIILYIWLITSIEEHIKNYQNTIHQNYIN